MLQKQITRTANSCAQPGDGLYHRALGLPANAAALWAGLLRLTYGAHAQSEANRDRYGAIPLYPEVEFDAADVVEVLVEQGRAVKAVLRFPQEGDKDLVYVLARPEQGAAFVRTVWINEARDCHRTLDRSHYRRIPEKNFAVS